LAGTALSATWIVDETGGPGVNFTDIPPALAAASPGDVVIVHGGTYSGFTLDKGVVLMGEGIPKPTLGTNSAIINDVQAGETAVMSGIKMYSCLIRQCQGKVMVDYCDMGQVTSDAAVSISNCSLVNLCRTHALGAPQSYGTGLKITDSTVVVSQCGFTGSTGKDSTSYGDGKNGYPGVNATLSSLYFLASSAYGGHGGKAYQDDFKIFDGGDGAPGILMANCTLHLFGTQEHTVSGGWGGYPSNWYADYGEDAHAVDATNCQVFYSGITLLTDSVIYVPPPVLGGDPIQYQHLVPDVPVMTMDESGMIGTTIKPILYGSSGWVYWLVASNGFVNLTLPFIYTQLFVDPTLLMIVASGTVGSSKEARFFFNIPNQPMFQGIAVHLQAYVDRGSGEYYLSTPVDFLIR
jgi:hypothetical protein